MVDNAVEAMANVPVKRVTVATGQVVTQMEIVVSDTCGGIPDDVLPKLFQEPIKKPKGTKGQGVGLLMAQTIVQAYQGEIRIESTDSTGATMVIELPLEV